MYHRLARDQQQLVGHPLRAVSPQGRLDTTPVDGRRLERITAYGKHLFHEFAGGATVHTHLGMQGTWFESDPDSRPKPQIRLRLAGARTAWDLVAPTTAEIVTTTQRDELIASLGPDPLDREADPARFTAIARSVVTPIGALLLDQHAIAGVGNVLRAEALHRTGIDPRTPASELDGEQFVFLWSTLVWMMRRAVEANAIEPNGRAVYKQTHCGQCRTAVVTSTVGGRLAYTCPACQRSERVAVA